MSTNNRFDADLGWQRILPRADRKTQSTELEELQRLVNYQQQSNFSYLLSKYSISKPIQVDVVGTTGSTFKIKISGGQVYFSPDDQGYFVDLDEQILTVPATGRTFIGVTLSFIEVGDEDESLKDPITGGSFCGDVGAHRIKLIYNLVLNQDSYPLILVRGFGLSTPPLIQTYKEHNFTQLQKGIPPNLEDYLATRWIEESGNFIAEGLEVVVALEAITAYPGSAYIEGKLVTIRTPFHIPLSTLSLGSVVYVYLSSIGQLDFSSKLVKLPNKLHLATLLLDPSTSKYLVRPSPDRVLTEAEIELILRYQQENEQKLAEIALKYEQLYQAVPNANLLDLEATLFNSLNKSDLFNPLYSATLIPTLGLARTGLETLNLDFTNLVNTDNLNSTIGFTNSSPSYLSSSLSEQAFISQQQVCSWVELNIGNKKIGSLKLVPAVAKPENGIDYISTVKPLNLLVEGTIVVGELEKKLQSQKITLSASGLTLGGDNFVLSFGSIRITEFELSNGTQRGSNANTIKAKLDGTIDLSFNIPNNLKVATYAVTLTNGQDVASAYFGSVTDIKPGALEGSGITQPFTLTRSGIIVGVNLAFRKAPLVTSNLVVAKVSISKLQNGNPVECLGCGNLQLSNLVTTEVGSAYSRVTFDRPVVLEAGEYGLVVETSLGGSELFIADTAAPGLNNKSLDKQNLTELRIFRSGRWETQLGKYLTFELIGGIPTSSNSLAQFLITNPLGNFHQIEMNLVNEVPCGTSIQLDYRTIGGDWREYNPKLPLNEEANQIELRFRFANTDRLCPIINLENSYIRLATNQKASSWVSTDFAFNPYTNAQLKFEYYSPTGSSITPYISANSGQSWRPLTLQKSELVDANIPLYRGIWEATNLPTTTTLTDLNNQTTSILRKNIRVRIDLSTVDAKLVPFIRSLTLKTY